MGKRIDLESLPEVKDWVTLPDVAKALELSRQQVHRMAASGEFETLSRIGTYVVVSSLEVFNRSLERGLDRAGWNM